MRSARTIQRRHSAYSLVEVMVVFTIIGVLTGLAAPKYQRAMEQSKADIAAANLRAIWIAERLYWLDNHAYTDDLAALQTAGVLDPALVTSAGGYTYSVTSASNDAFEAAATRVAPCYWVGSYTIDESGVLSGALHAAGTTDITAGFQ